MSSIHTYAFCRCGWHLENPSNAAVERHAQSGHAPVTRFHLRNYCTAECANRSEPDKE
jgi:hypothetical protein